MHWFFFFFKLCNSGIICRPSTELAVKSKTSVINAALHIRHVEVSSWCSIIHDLTSYVYREHACSVDNISNSWLAQKRTVSPTSCMHLWINAWTTASNNISNQDIMHWHRKLKAYVILVYRNKWKKGHCCIQHMLSTKTKDFLVKKVNTIFIRLTHSYFCQESLNSFPCFKFGNPQNRGSQTLIGT